MKYIFMNRKYKHSILIKSKEKEKRIFLYFTTVIKEIYLVKRKEKKMFWHGTNCVVDEETKWTRTD
jgi:hypothetical protein